MKSNALAQHSREEAVLVLENALAAALNQLFDLRQKADQQKPTDPNSLRAISARELMEKPLATKVDIMVSNINSYGYEQASVLCFIQKTGEAINRIGGMDLMEDVSDRVANKPLACLGHTEKGSDFQKQTGVLSVFWDGIGDWFH